MVTSVDRRGRVPVYWLHAPTFVVRFSEAQIGLLHARCFHVRKDRRQMRESR
jgi:hypothetical protein